MSYTPVPPSSSSRRGRRGDDDDDDADRRRWGKKPQPTAPKKVNPDEMNDIEQLMAGLSMTPMAKDWGLYFREHNQIVATAEKMLKILGILKIKGWGKTIVTMSFASGVSITTTIEDGKFYLKHGNIPFLSKVLMRAKYPSE
jgi:hypothetical protein